MSETYRNHLKARLTQVGVPEGLHRGLIEYIAARRPMGGFLTAIVENNLREAVTRGDPENRVRLHELVLFLNNFAPATCWGSPETVANWLLADVPAPEVFE